MSYHNLKWLADIGGNHRANSTLSIRHSWLNVLRDPTGNDWCRRWFDLKRPYLFVYESVNASKLLSVINVSAVRVETSPEMTAVVGKDNIFAIYTAQVRCPLSPYEIVLDIRLSDSRCWHRLALGHRIATFYKPLRLKTCPLG